MKQKLEEVIILGIMCCLLMACGTGDKEQSVYVQPEMKGEINVSVYQSSEWLETAVMLFQEKYPDMTVNIHPFYTGEDVLVTENGGTTTMSVRPAGQTREDYLSQLNTKLLAGSADDIVITSEGLPLESYINMGVFVDLSLYFENAEEINEENYYMNIFDAYRTEEGELYQLPLSAMSCPMICFDKELADATGFGPDIDAKALTWREALDIGKKMYDASEYVNTFMPEAWSLVADIFTKTVISSVDYENGVIRLDEDELWELFAIFEELEYYQSCPMGFDVYNNECHEAFKMSYSQDTMFAVSAVQGHYIATPWKQDDGQVYLSPYYALDFGISGKSQNKELAWEFLRFLLSDEVQTLPSFPNSGVNKKGLVARVERQADAWNCTEEEKKLVVETVEGWISQITAYRAEDTDLIQISEGTYFDYVNGVATEEETIAALKEHLEQYISQ